MDTEQRALATGATKPSSAGAADGGPGHQDGPERGKGVYAAWGDREAMSQLMVFLGSVSPAVTSGLRSCRQMGGSRGGRSSGPCYGVRVALSRTRDLRTHRTAVTATRSAGCSQPRPRPVEPHRPTTDRR